QPTRVAPRKHSLVQRRILYRGTSYRILQYYQIAPWEWRPHPPLMRQKRIKIGGDTHVRQCVKAMSVRSLVTYLRIAEHEMRIFRRRSFDFTQRSHRKSR